MKKKILIPLILTASVFLIFAAGCGPKGPTPVKAGDAVIALWSGNSWYLGTADAACDKGLNIKWADGTSPTCVLTTDIFHDTTATKDTAVVGANVYAKWYGSAFYKATITAVKGDKYSVKYYDGITKDDLTLADLRM